MDRDLLTDLGQLRTVQADDFRLCCRQVLPEAGRAVQCHAPSPHVSTCDHLLGASQQRRSVSVLAALALLGNVGLLLAGSRVRAASRTVGGEWRSTDTFVFQLSVSHGMEGVYLAALAIRGQMQDGPYLWEDVFWRHSPWCAACGFVLLLSCQLSVFLTLALSLRHCAALWRRERVTALNGRVAPVLCAVCWAVAVMLAGLPLLGPWERSVYSASSVCVAAPDPSSSRPGHHYVFALLAVLNPALALVTLVGQAYISIKVRHLSLTSLLHDQGEGEGGGGGGGQLTVADCTAYSTAGHCCCWVLVSTSVVMMSQGVLTSDNTTLVLPVILFSVAVHSSVQPCLQVLGCVTHRRSQLQRQRLMKRLGRQLANRQRKDDRP